MFPIRENSDVTPSAQGWFCHLALAFTLVVLAVPGLVRAESLVPNVVEDFEGPNFWDNWSADGGTWQWGVPTSGPNAAHHGSNVVATVLGGDYAEDTSGRLVSLLSFVVPS